ncbi:hypothetical protein, partial [Klebsiella pneumoniae]|uniref:hypothetical protein n=1 Tax=Klebsiella pneumoniae TaxID=573 RepID=UPI001CC21EB8
IKRLKLSRNNSKSASYANIIFSFGFIVLSNLIAVHANHFLHNCHGLAAHLNCTFQSANKKGSQSFLFYIGRSELI